jgi:hypothetical protein
LAVGVVMVVVVLAAVVLAAVVVMVLAHGAGQQPAPEREREQTFDVLTDLFVSRSLGITIVEMVNSRMDQKGIDQRSGATLIQ